MDEGWGILEPDLLSQTHDVSFDGVRERVGHLVPDMFKKKTARYN